MGIIGQFFNEHGGAAALSLALIAAWWGGMKIIRIWSKQDHLENTQKNTAKEIELIWRTLEDVSEQLSKITQIQNSESATIRKSPLQLSPLGHKIKDALNAPAILEEHGESLRQLVFAKGKPTNAYDLQRNAFNVAKYELPGMLTQEKLDAAKNLAYKHDLLFSEIMMVFGVLLRDELMEEEGFASIGKIAQQAQNQNAAHASK